MEKDTKQTVLFNGYYNCMHRRGDGSFERLRVPCEVLAQSTKTYTIRLKSPNVNGHRWGDVIRVQKRMVTPERDCVDCSGKWWND